MTSDQAPLRRRRSCVALVVAIAPLLLMLPLRLAADSPANAKPFDIPAATADKSLPQLSDQSGLEILFGQVTASRIRTNAIKGSYAPREALKLLLEGTGLVAVADAKTGAFSVRKETAEEARNRHKAAAGDRLDKSQKKTEDRTTPAQEPMNRNKLYTTFLAAAAFLATPAIHAAEGTGAITGRVFNPATGEYVRNAEVRIQGTNRTAVTEQDGSFRFSNVPAGETTISVLYTGYHPSTEIFTVVEGGTAVREISITSTAYGARMADGTVRLQEFVVSSEREGNAKAIMEQRHNMNISTSVASDVFGDIPDGNVGEFIKYLPGVEIEEVAHQARAPRLGGLEPHFTGVAIDGVKMASADGQLTYGNLENSGGAGEYARATGFDQVSLNSVEAIEISVTLSPDMDADAPAGRINMKTKRAFDLKGRRVTYQFGAAFNSTEFTLKKTPGPYSHEDYKVRPNYILGYSESFFNNRFGVLLNISQAKTFNEQQRVTFTQNRTPVGADQRPVVITQISFADIPGFTDRFGTTFTADFKATPRLTFGLTTIFNAYEHYNDNRTLNFNFASNNTTAATGRQNVLGDGITTLQTNGLANNTQRTVTMGGVPQGKRTNTITYTPKFEYRRGPLKINGTYGYSRSKNTYQALERGHAAPLNGAFGGTDFIATRPSPTSPEWTIRQIDGPDWSDYSQYPAAVQLGNDMGQFVRTKVSDAQLDAQYALPFRFASFIKLGGKLNEESRQAQNPQPFKVWRYIGPARPGNNWSAYPTGHPFDMGVGHGKTWLDIPNMPPRADTEAVGTLFREHPEYFEHAGTPAQFYEGFITNDRNFLQRIVAGYGMANVRLGRTQIQGGMRWERTVTYSKEWNPLTAAQVQAAGFPINASTRRASTIPGLEYQYFSQPRITRKGEYDNWFPSLSAKIDIVRNLNLHVGYNRAISRPPINALSGVWSINDESLTINAPNPNLLPSDSDKLVARLAYYFEPVGSLTLQVSENKISNLRRTFRYSAEEFGYGDDPSWAVYEFISTTNDPFERRLRSLEFGYNQALSFLPGVLRGLNLSLAYTRNYANVRRQGVAPHRISGNLGWAWNRYALRFGAVWMDETPWTGGAGIVAWRTAYARYDLSGSLRLTRRVNLFFQGRNITNVPNLVYSSLTGVQGADPLLHRAQNFGANWLFGVKGSF